MSMDESIVVPKTFQALDFNKEIRIYRRALPHWRQEGATYFVTFRLADSLPAQAISGMEIERKNFLAMIDRFKLEGDALRKASDQFWKSYGRSLDKYLDAGTGSCLMRDVKVSRVVMDAFEFFEGKRTELYAADVMPNHCHILVRPLGNHQLEDILESWKGFTARKINQLLKREGQVWQEDSFDRIVRDEAHFRKVVAYIQYNPRSAKLRGNEFRLSCGGRGS